MTNEELNLTPDDGSDLPDDELRFAPQVDAAETPDAEADEMAADIEVDEPVPDNDVPVTDGMDIEAALAAVSTLSDMLAEQEAAEQARIAQIEAEAQAAAERQARMEHPEQFFPVPPMPTLHRGQMASVIPALLLIVIGGWLTFSFTTKSSPDASLITAITLGGIGLVLLVRWLGSGRWARGSLFGGLSFLFSAGLLCFLLSSQSPGLLQGWPLLLVGIGIAAALTGFLAFPRNRRLLLSGLGLIVAGIAGSIITMNVLSSDFVNTAASFWPVALIAVIIVWLLPVIFRQRS
ncbi:MAG: hypothetical protein ABI690_21320 [Chloroflexota bacterium]